VEFHEFQQAHHAGLQRLGSQLREVIDSRLSRPKFSKKAALDNDKQGADQKTLVNDLITIVNQHAEGAFLEAATRTANAVNFRASRRAQRL
jgi:hypothetical protein